MLKLDKLDRKLLFSLALAFIMSVIYLYLFSFFINTGPASKILLSNPWVVIVASWDLAVFVSAREYLRAWESQLKLKGGQLF
jgi:hypothetical protein